MSAPGYSFGGRLFLAILAALILGYGWACVEAGRSPLAILKLFESKDPAPPPAPAKPPVTAKKDPAPMPPPSSGKTDPVPPPTPPTPPPPPPSALRTTYSDTEVNTLFVTLDDCLRRGRFFEASENLNRTEKLRMPADSAARLADYEARIRKYNDLMKETTMQSMVEMPKISKIAIQGAGQLVVKVLAEDTRAVYYETITGIKSSIERSRIESLMPLQPHYAAAEIKIAHMEQARARGLDVEDDPGKPLKYKDRPGVKHSGQQFFDLADFCARNGANHLLIPLFDEALQRDPDLINTVHETRADRMVEVFLYFLSINSRPDANNALSLLKKHYQNTRAYRDRVESNTDVQEVISMSSGRRPAPGPVAVAPKPARPAPGPSPTPKPSDPAPPPDPTPPPTPVAPSDPGPGDDRPSNPTTIAMEGAPAKVAALVAQGDKYYAEAERHLNASNPQDNPTGCVAENKMALEFFNKAQKECYLPAQDAYGDASIPTALLDRVRETGLRLRVCRIRSVSSRNK